MTWLALPMYQKVAVLLNVLLETDSWTFPKLAVTAPTIPSGDVIFKILPCADSNVLVPVGVPGWFINNAVVPLNPKSKVPFASTNNVELLLIVRLFVFNWTIALALMAIGTPLAPVPPTTEAILTNCVVVPVKLNCCSIMFPDLPIKGLAPTVIFPFRFTIAKPPVTVP